MNLPTKNYLERLPSFHVLDVFTLNAFANESEDFSYYFPPIRSKYYSPYNFPQSVNFLKKHPKKTSFSLLHNKIRSLKHNLENLETHLLNELSSRFSVKGVTETRIRNANIFDFNPSLLNYNFEFIPMPLSTGGIGMFFDNTFNYKVLEKCSNESFQVLWIEIILPKTANIICGVIYRQHNTPNRFLSFLD